MESKMYFLSQETHFLLKDINYQIHFFHPHGTWVPYAYRIKNPTEKIEATIDNIPPGTIKFYKNYFPHAGFNHLKKVLFYSDLLSDNTSL